jgi:hypothetical protein
MKFLRTITSLSLALLVLMSSTSFVVGMHICMGEVKDVAVFSKAEGCEMEKRLPPCHKHAKAPCCEDETVVHQGLELKSLDPIAFGVPLAVEFEAPLTLYSEIIPSSSTSREYYLNYDPPLLLSDRVIQHQVFII